MKTPTKRAASAELPRRLGALLSGALLSCALVACAVKAPAPGDDTIAATQKPLIPLPAPAQPPRASAPVKPPPAIAGEAPSKPSDTDASSESDAADAFVQEGLASWYGARFHRRRTASGERFDMNEFTAAHRTLPFGTRVCVRSLVTGRAVQVRINDRGPHSPGRIIDVSRAAAGALGLLGLGTKPVVVSQAPEDAAAQCPDASVSGLSQASPLPASGE
ncbi:septal ring lytic transglycosylase RlpA family protein [Acidovorax sp. BLS4]|uniref:septal ring lytic transglycosylase RlpA family protein n=1 Tax=Acidovorax sp. BLS4 TaxID=3273430 RepID=UPI0029422DB8|nr:septal ring lytic transglycosylase RlpA family protein [Paracidovorax avenae]WOI44191.1 septal ring lytic transglycosylase RlpA family protein [Paracidovorax avenae]